MCDIDINCDLFEFVQPKHHAYCILWVPNVQCFYLICNFCNFFSYVSVNSLVLSHWANSDAHDLCFSEFIFATRDAKLKIMAMPPEIPDEQHILPHLHLKVQCSSKQIINLEPRTFFQLVPSVMSCFK